jgi:hypothetical protein
MELFYAIMGGLIFILIIFFYWQKKIGTKTVNKLAFLYNNRGEYAVGKIIRTSGFFVVFEKIGYQFEVNGKAYSKTIPLQNIGNQYTSRSNGQKYIVLYLPEDPNCNQIITVGLEKDRDLEQYIHLRFKYHSIARDFQIVS